MNKQQLILGSKVHFQVWNPKTKEFEKLELSTPQLPARIVKWADKLEEYFEGIIKALPTLHDPFYKRAVELRAAAFAATFHLLHSRNDPAEAIATLVTHVNWMQALAGEVLKSAKPRRSKS